MYITCFIQLKKIGLYTYYLKYTSLIYTDYTWNVQNGIDKSLDQCNQVIYVLPEIYFTNLYRFPETEILLYIDLKTWLGGNGIFVPPPPPPHTLLTPHFYFPLELYVYITLTNNYLSFFMYQLIILWTISINWHWWLLVNNHISKYNSFIFNIGSLPKVHKLRVCVPPPPPPTHTFWHLPMPLIYIYIYNTYILIYMHMHTFIETVKIHYAKQCTILSELLEDTKNGNVTI